MAIWVQIPDGFWILNTRSVSKPNTKIHVVHSNSKYWYEYRLLIYLLNSITCVRVKLFLQQFGVAACILNSQLPLNCRCVYRYVIALYAKRPYRFNWHFLHGLRHYPTLICIASYHTFYWSRLHVVNEFNAGRYDLLIASDEARELGQSAPQAGSSNASAASEERSSERQKKRNKKHSADDGNLEYATDKVLGEL